LPAVWELCHSPSCLLPGGIPPPCLLLLLLLSKLLRVPLLHVVPKPLLQLRLAHRSTSRCQPLLECTIGQSGLEVSTSSTALHGGNEEMNE
jgi:hypothetical protein